MAYSPPPPPPPPPPPLQTATFAAASSGSARSSLTLSPSVLIIFAIIAFVFLASVAIHLFLRFLSRSPASFRRRGHHHHRAAAAPRTEGSTPKEVSDGEKATIIERLPLFTLASALSALPKSSPDCAVCQEPFRPDDELRLLPACRHAFHSRCVDPWLRSTLLCPLCRSSIALPFPPLILPPPTTPTTPAAAAAAAAATAPPINDDDDPSLRAAPRSGSFRIEMGTVSRRRTPPEDAGARAPHTIRSYAMESYDYLVEEEVEAVISVIPQRRAEAASAAAKDEKPPEGSGRYRVKDRLDRFTGSASASASSSFNSLRWSSRWSNRYDDGGGWREGSWWGDLEGSQAQAGDEGGGLYAFYRWFTGV